MLSTTAGVQQGDLSPGTHDLTQSVPLDLLGLIFRFLCLLVEEIEHRRIPSYGAIYSQFPLLKTLAFSAIDHN